MHIMLYHLSSQALQKGGKGELRKALCISFRFTHFHRQVLLKL